MKRKEAAQFVGRYIITKVRSASVYDIKNLDDVDDIDTVNVMFLKRVTAEPRQATKPGPIHKEGQDEWYEVDRIADVKKDKLLVYWKGYPDSAASWIDKKQIAHSKQLRKHYEEFVARRKQSMEQTQLRRSKRKQAATTRGVSAESPQDVVAVPSEKKKKKQKKRGAPSFERYVEPLPRCEGEE
eukprot:m.118904 g.118904  ORF g.118904 m.118904 type:complete len:184 (+) comp13668_c0_seq4:1-552(+)